jgi:isoleucyl-tRNA synthetase
MASKQHSIKPVDSRPDFVKLEQDLLKKWQENGIVEKYLNKNKDSEKTFSFIDGPITANNPMGVHHAWGRTYKDLWQRYKNMQGFSQRFQNGFDCQGLWVEVEVEKDLGFKTKKDIEEYGVEKFVQKCKDRVIKYSSTQTEQSKRLGYFMDWENSYYTMSDINNYMIWNFLKVCHKNGWLYKGNDSVPWCPRCQTAISQHEMLTEDYKEVVHDSIYLSLPIVDRENEYLLIWTTTPWTIPANTAVAVDPKIKYVLVQKESHRYWVAKDLKDKIFKTQDSVEKTVLGKELVGLKYKAPFDSLPAVKKVLEKNKDNFHTVIATDTLIMPITMTDGTGLVHTAVSAGTEDFKLGKKYNLPMVPVIEDDASYKKDLGFLTGQNAKKHPEIILDFLKEQDKKGDNWVFKISPFKHRYPACWRCKKELVWKVTDEWYIAMDKGKPSLRQRMQRVTKKINWIPKFGLDRELDWLANMHDWLISKKNRYWGLSLPIWECQACKSFEVIGSKEELEEKAVQGWEQFKGHSPHKPFIDKIKIKCTKCGKLASRVEPVGNPWLDAGIVPFSTLKYNSDAKYFKKWFPADFITESFPGQFKNWFYSLIAMSSVLEDTNPFKNVLGFATALAENGKEMHKSDGTSIEFNQAADQIGVDVMRWLYVKQNPEKNLLFGYNNANEAKRQFHMFLWNSYRFFVNYVALENWQPKKNLINNQTVLDQWILSRLDQVVLTTTSNLDKFNASSGARAIEEFVNDFSTWYIRRSRDRVGPGAADKEDKEICYQTFFTILETISRLLMPYTPFLADAIYTNLTGQESVNLASWPKKPNPKDIDKKLQGQMSLVRKICEQGHAQRKIHEIAVKQPLASITVTANDPLGLEKSIALLQLIKEELNIEKVIFKKDNLENSESNLLSVELDIKLTADLVKKREARETIRQIQQLRKDSGCKLDQVISVTLPSWPKKYEDQIKTKTLVDKITKGEKVTIIK